MSSDICLSVKGLTKSYGDRAVLRDINFNVQKGECLALIGASGCGKSTLLRIIAGLEDFSKGEISFGELQLNGGTDNSHDLKTLRGQVQIVFQSYNLFSHLSLLENLILPQMIVKNVSRTDAESRADQLLNSVGLKTHAQHYPRQLSGGQQQRGAIARALAMNPKVLLLDEPTSALDPNLVREVYDVLMKLKQQGLSLILVTHDLHLASRLADRVLFIDEGKVIECDTPDRFLRAPQTKRAKEFLSGFLDVYS